MLNGMKIDGNSPGDFELWKMRIRNFPPNFW